MRTRRRFSPFFLFLAFSFLFSTQSAFAAVTAYCELTVIEASNNGKGIDPELAGIKELTTPPLSTTYTRFKFLGKDSHTLSIGIETTFTPTKLHTAKFKFIGEEASEDKLKLHIDLPEPKFSTDLKVKNGGTITFAKQSGIIHHVKCTKKP